ncbi:class I SAM-dependent methyltransferase [Sphingomonas sp.]|uniref:class I SAM-dependent methyltransferase n=1 Tax=Sphingomonas sp. TaxID=28214 RepID=UPI0035BC11A0
MDAMLAGARRVFTLDGARVVFARAIDRVRRRVTRLDLEAVRRWCAASAIDQAAWAAAIDPGLWAEASAFESDLRNRASRLLASAQGRYGGGGAVALLYFLVRLRRPHYVVETGVAAGWSTAAILAAMEQNGAGHLWSSDFPYFRHGGNTAEIGLLVPGELRPRWTLTTRGDQVNLPQILAEMPRVDFLHYDSDKSRAGRAWALALLRPKLIPGATIVFDDIQDNWHFRQIAGDRPLIFGENGKFVGLLDRGGRDTWK